MEEHRSFGEMRAEIGFGKSMPWMMTTLTLQSFSGIFTDVFKLPSDLRGPMKSLRYSSILKHLKLQPSIFIDMQNCLPCEGLKE